MDRVGNAPPAPAGEQRTSWVGREVVLVGRFASMSRASVRTWLTQAEARTVTAAGPATDLVIVGQGAPPLGPDGQPVAKLREALRLQRETGRPRILREEEWLAELDSPREQAPSLERLYTSQQLARILSVSEAQLRSWVCLLYTSPSPRD